MVDAPLRGGCASDLLRAGGVWRRIRSQARAGGARDENPAATAISEPGCCHGDVATSPNADGNGNGGAPGASVAAAWAMTRQAGQSAGCGACCRSGRGSPKACDRQTGTQPDAAWTIVSSARDP